MEALLNFARAIRLWLYDFTSTKILGVEVDVFLHFIFAGVIFAFIEQRAGTRRAVQALAALIVLKEIVDIFLKSQLRYIKRPTPEIMLDIGLDVLMGVLGGLAAWWWRRHRAAHTATAR